MKEYNIEGNQEVDVLQLRTDFIPTEKFRAIHELSVIPCHDVFIWYKKGILLVKRDNVPAKGDYFPIGGRILRGVPTTDSLKIKAKQECNLDLDEIVQLGVARTFWMEDPFQHYKGTDTINMVYTAVGRGKLKLDSLHQDPMIITAKTYEGWKDSLHPYVRDFMDVLFSGQ